MGFQTGNSFGGRRKEKLCYDALMLELKATPDNDPRSLRGIMRNLITLAAGGDLQAIKELMNRIDGTPVQTVENLNENVNYVALMPPKADTMEEWANRYAKTQIQAPTTRQ